MRYVAVAHENVNLIKETGNPVSLAPSSLGVFALMQIYSPFLGLKLQEHNVHLK